jgi:hypothetical protein
VTRLGPGKVSVFLRQQSDELTRIWRLARASERLEVFPGLLDDLVGRFFLDAADLLAANAAPEDLWRGLSGLVRWPPPLAPGELTEEWAILLEVLSAACESVNADPSVSTWLTRAVAACEVGTKALGGGRGKAPEGIVTAIVFSPLEPRHRRDEKGENAA